MSFECYSGPLEARSALPVIISIDNTRVHLSCFARKKWPFGTILFFTREICDTVALVTYTEVVPGVTELTMQCKNVLQ